MKDKSCLHERARILIAYELRIPPDDIDLSQILKSIFRAIRESCENNTDEIFALVKREKNTECQQKDEGSALWCCCSTDDHNSIAPYR